MKASIAPGTIKSHATISSYFWQRPLSVNKAPAFLACMLYLIISPLQTIHAGDAGFSISIEIPIGNPCIRSFIRSMSPEQRQVFSNSPDAGLINRIASSCHQPSADKKTISEMNNDITILDDKSVNDVNRHIEYL